MQIAQISIHIKNQEEPMQNKYPAMRGIWLLNAIQNALHEPNCLMRDYIEAKESMSEILLKGGFGSDEREFIINELETAQKRMEQSGEYIAQIQQVISALLGNIK
jgi:hypothetical protein